ncbi:MAG: hypothetical protein J7K68_02445 [Candidatus Diapherotrites archaeon]|nr:hypothetical protein [Candidatus Diapherotrites archaeon]
MKIPQFLKTFLKKREEEETFEPTEISPGDIERIEEIKKWLKEGKTEEWIYKEMKKMGYIDYHIDFLLRKATGRKEERPPEELLERKRLRELKKKEIRDTLIAVAILAIVIFIISKLKGG